MEQISFLDPSNDPELFNALPKLFKELAGGIPLADLLKLSEVFGGARFYTPKTLSESHFLVEGLGEEATRRLINRCGGEYLTVPVCVNARRIVRSRQAWQLREQGQPMREIAQTLKTTDRNIQRMLREEHRRRARSTAPRMDGACLTKLERA